MADRPKSYRSGHNLSRRTIVMRKAKDEDARRLAEKEESQRMSDAALTHAVRKSATTRISTPGRKSRSVSDRSVSGRTVVVHREGAISNRLDVSTRISGPQASVRVTGGDTIIRYESGDMVVKRGARRARLRRQLIWAYALGYLLLFGLYLFFLITGTTLVEPMDFVQRSFARRHSSDVIDLERAALEAMRGNRTPAEIRLAETISFYDENHDTIQVAAGDRLTLLTAAKLGRAILEDQTRPVENRTFAKPFKVYRESYLSNLNWPYWLTVYNAIGFFLLLLLFLWRPLQNYLGTQGKKTAVALRNSQEAQDEAEEYRNKYRNMAAELEQRSESLRNDIDSSIEEERAAALDNARKSAERIAGGIETALDTEARARTERLGEHAAREACRLARELLEKRLGQAEHDAAIDELIADIGAVRVN